MFLWLFVLSMMLCTGLMDQVQVAKKSICFHGEAADEMLKRVTDRNCEHGGNDDEKPIDCEDIGKKHSSGVYRIFPKGYDSGFGVYCNMETDGGGWTVFQRRFNGKTDFFRDWSAYEKGFGNLEKEFWLGNSKLHALTSQGKYELRVDLEDFENQKRYAKYSTFSVGDASSKYKLTVGGYKGDAGDSLLAHNGQAFSTKDQDNDKYGGNCAVMYKGAWWYAACHRSNLNGLYLKGKHKSYADGIEWYHWKGYYYSLQSTSMMIRKLK